MRVMFFIGTILSCFTLGHASHSLDLGTFFSSHKEKHYSYDLWGASFSYEIGNSKGLKAIGKVLFTNESDLIFINARNEFQYHFISDELDLIGFTGIYSHIHQVEKEKGAIATLNRSYFPLGIGAVHHLEDLSLELKFAYLFPLSHSLVRDEGNMFYGNHYFLPADFFAEIGIKYAFTDKFKALLHGSWQEDFKKTQSTLVLQAGISAGF